MTDPVQPDEDWRAAMLGAVRAPDLTMATDAILSITYHDPDRSWVESLLLAVIADVDLNIQVRLLAVTCLGHLARIHRGISQGDVLPVLYSLRQTSEFGGVAQDALDDIEIYARRPE